MAQDFCGSRDETCGSTNVASVSTIEAVLQVTIALPSGQTVSLSLPESSKVGDLKTLAQQSFGKSCLQLATASGRILSSTESLQVVLADNDHLTAISFGPSPRLAATEDAFALCLAAELWHGAIHTMVVTVQHQLRNVQQIQAADKAFAAILEDGSVVTWGDSHYGGDSSAVQHQLRNVQQIQAADKAFAAILEDGSVVTWGDSHYGGDSSAVQHQLRNVQQIQAADKAFAAILEDGSVVTWGDSHYGGDSSAVQHQLRNVQQIQAADKAFAAILEDGSLAAVNCIAHIALSSLSLSLCSLSIEIFWIHLDNPYSPELSLSFCSLSWIFWIDLA